MKKNRVLPKYLLDCEKDLLFIFGGDKENSIEMCALKIHKKINNN